MKCRISKKKSKVFLDFGRMPLANGFINKNQNKKEYFYSLRVAFNKELNLFQLASNPPPIKMFNKSYPFYTSSSNYMKNHFNAFAKFIKKKYIKKNSLIIELGSNDGTFLENFKDSNLFGSDFTGANITNASFDGANLNNSIWIDGAKCNLGSIGVCKK